MEGTDRGELPDSLAQLLTDLSDPSPTRVPLEELPRLQEFGTLFTTRSRKEMNTELRLQVLAAIGKCTTLKRITITADNQIGVGCEEEVEVLVRGLASSLVLEELTVEYCRGFGTEAACQALGHLVSRSHSLEVLRLGWIGMDSAGLGHIAEALQANTHCPLYRLSLIGNPVGNAVGAAHIAQILTSCATLFILGLVDISLDLQGAQILAGALARTTTLRNLNVGSTFYQQKGVAVAYPLNVLLDALAIQPVAAILPSETSSPASKQDWNTSITTLVIEMRNKSSTSEEIMSAKCISRLLRNNNSLQRCCLRTSRLGFTSFTSSSCRDIFEALLHNTTLTSFFMDLMTKDCLADDACELLLRVVQENSVLRKLKIPYCRLGRDAKYKFFRSLQSTCLVELSIAGWLELDDGLFKVLMESLEVNTNLQSLDLSGTSWERDGKLALVKQALRRNQGQVAYLPVLRAGLKFVPPTAGRLFLCGPPSAGQLGLHYPSCLFQIEVCTVSSALL